MAQMTPHNRTMHASTSTAQQPAAHRRNSRSSGPIASTLRVLAVASCAACLLASCGKIRRDLNVPILASSDINLSGLTITLDNVKDLNWSNVALDIDNQRGDINILVSDKITSPVVLAGSPGTTEEQRRVDFVTAQLNNDGPQPVLRVVASTPGAQAPKIVNITIELPAIGGLRIRNADGRIYAKGISGAVDVMNSFPSRTGGTTIIMSSPALDPVLIRASTGGIDLRLAPGSNGDLRAQTRKGKVTLDLGEAKVHNSTTVRGEHTATINAGNNPITLAADSGDIILMYGR